MQHIDAIIFYLVASLDLSEVKLLANSSTLDTMSEEQRAPWKKLHNGRLLISSTKGKSNVCFA